MITSGAAGDANGGYGVDVTSETDNVFTIDKAADATVTRTCVRPGGATATAARQIGDW